MNADARSSIQNIRLSLGSPWFGMEILMINGKVEITELVDIAGRFVLSLIALCRAERNDIPTVAQELSSWWRCGS
jgi:hypothetical protein